jgi:hypothetical protein
MLGILSRALSHPPLVYPHPYIHPYIPSQLFAFWTVYTLHKTSMSLPSTASLCSVDDDDHILFLMPGL